MSSPHAQKRHGFAEDGFGGYKPLSGEVFSGKGSGSGMVGVAFPCQGRPRRRVDEEGYFREGFRRDFLGAP